MPYRWVVSKDILADCIREHKTNAHNSLWELDFGVVSKLGCFGTVIDTGDGDNDYVVGERMEVQWPSSCWQQIDELEEFVRETRVAAGIGE